MMQKQTNTGSLEGVPRRVYMDYAATTPVRSEVREAMLPFLGERFGNPSSIYTLAREEREAVESSREHVAKALGVLPEEIYFTSGGTESDNWAIKGVVAAGRKRGNHIITTVIEHHAVIHTMQYLQLQGYKVTYVPVDQNGLLDPLDVEEAITGETVLVSVMTANNEIGTIEPIRQIGAIAYEKGIPFHTDAVQAVGHIPISPDNDNIDLLSLSAHKFSGPKGVGALYIRKGTRIDNLLHGGSQERRRRSGTENVPGIAGLSTGLDLAIREMRSEADRLSSLRDRLISSLLSSVPHSRLNGHSKSRLPGNANMSFEFVEGESMVLLLDREGISASTGSACTSGSLEPSHVLVAIGLPHEIAHGSLRLTMGSGTTGADVDQVIDAVPRVVSRLRSMSPLYRETGGECHVQ